MQEEEKHSNLDMSYKAGKKKQEIILYEFSLIHFNIISVIRKNKRVWGVALVKVIHIYQWWPKWGPRATGSPRDIFW